VPDDPDPEVPETPVPEPDPVLPELDPDVPLADAPLLILLVSVPPSVFVRMLVSVPVVIPEPAALPMPVSIVVVPVPVPVPVPLALFMSVVVVESPEALPLLLSPQAAKSESVMAVTKIRFMFDVLNVIMNSFNAKLRIQFFCHLFQAVLYAAGRFLSYSFLSTRIFPTMLPLFHKMIFYQQTCYQAAFY